MERLYLSVRLFLGIPFTGVNSESCEVIECLATISQTHTNRQILGDRNAIFLPGIKPKVYVTFNIMRNQFFLFTHDF